MGADKCHALGCTFYSTVYLTGLHGSKGGGKPINAYLCRRHGREARDGDSIVLKGKRGRWWKPAPKGGSNE